MSGRVAAPRRSGAAAARSWGLVGRRAIGVVTTLVGAGCGAGSSGFASSLAPGNGVPGPSLLRISPDTLWLRAAPSLFRGGVGRLTARDPAGRGSAGSASGRDSSGSSRVVWYSLDSRIADVSTDGLVFGRLPGATRVIARSPEGYGAADVLVVPEPDTAPTVIAHRGFQLVLPENTLEAVAGAFDLGADTKHLLGKARNFNWHNVIGFWTSLILIILTATAVVMSYQWANNLVYTMTGNEIPKGQQRPPNPRGEEKEAPENLPENTEDLWTKAENLTNWQSISLRLPITKEANFTVDEGIYWNKFGRSNLTLDAESGEIIKWETYGEQNAGRQLRSWVRFTHTGETGGILGQFIGFIACIGGAFLVWTGFSLALRHFLNWRKRKEIKA